MLCYNLQTISYMAERVVGTGSFGIVFQVKISRNAFSDVKRLIFLHTPGLCMMYLPFWSETQAKCLETGEAVAIKKVLQDKRYKNRELQLMRVMDHPNVISLKHCFFSTTSRDELFLNLVMEYVPETMYRVLKHYNNINQRMPLIYVKLYTYQVWGLLYLHFGVVCCFSVFHLKSCNDCVACELQIFRGLAYIHTVPGVCHRDVKPQNLLVSYLFAIFFCRWSAFFYFKPIVFLYHRLILSLTKLSFAILGARKFWYVCLHFLCAWLLIYVCYHFNVGILKSYAT